MRSKVEKRIALDLRAGFTSIIFGTVHTAWGMTAAFCWQGPCEPEQISLERDLKAMAKPSRKNEFQHESCTGCDNGTYVGAPGARAVCIAGRAKRGRFLVNGKPIAPKGYG